MFANPSVNLVAHRRLSQFGVQQLDSYDMPRSLCTLSREMEASSKHGSPATPEVGAMNALQVLDQADDLGCVRKSGPCKLQQIEACHTP